MSSGKFALHVSRVEIGTLPLYSQDDDTAARRARAECSGNLELSEQLASAICINKVHSKHGDKKCALVVLD
jgi:hypothetical protein